MYPVDARSGRRNEHAAKTDVIPATVPSIVFSIEINEQSRWEIKHSSKFSFNKEAKLIYTSA